VSAQHPSKSEAEKLTEQVSVPVHPLPPHCPYLAMLPAAAALEVAAAAVVVRVALAVAVAEAVAPPTAV
jgi:hypothetical protein